ncbi:hypothetical protein [Planctomycetes bacterium K23_9]|uniref:Uncharacterized protein n=1 Tax=Stieleria marina TaxID=1930275 RepID=A0A517P073_9BACT|nr:hypothetical protein K239x_47890 [Planctomycetes bacterium K23_9]
MPDPLLYTKAMGVAAFISMALVLAIFAWRRRLKMAELNSVCVVGIGFGLVAGYAVLALNLSWPPANALDRLLLIIVPATLVIELIAGFQRVPRAVAWLIRISLALVAPWILLHNSIYLNDSGDWTPWQVGLVIVVSAALLILVWGLFSVLSQRSGGVSLPIAVCIAVQCAGVAVMLAGYIKGGAAAIPLVATLLGTSIVVQGVARFFSGKIDVSLPQKVVVPGVVGVGLVGLFGLLFIGRFFGEISTLTAVTILAAPLLCWLSEARQLRNRKPWIIAAFRLIVVAIPLVVVLLAAKREFDREMSPLLGAAGRQDDQRATECNASHFLILGQLLAERRESSGASKSEGLAPFR